MKTSIPWPRILAEGVAIVVSILLAFGIQAWWEGVQEREEEQELLATIHADLDASRELLQENVAAVEADQGALRALAAMSVAEAETTDPETIWGSYLINLYRPRTVELRLGSLEATINSGKLELIRAPVLRAALVELMTAAANLAEQRMVITQISADATHALTGHAEVAQELTLRGGRGMGARIEPSAFARVRADPDVMAFVADKVLRWNGYLLESRRLLEQVEETMRITEESLRAAP